MIRLVLTCQACPEQYDVVDENGREIGYLRLRHGYFTAHADGVGGPLVYEATTIGDGIFDPDERKEHLDAAVHAIVNYRPDRSTEYIIDRSAYDKT